MCWLQELKVVLFFSTVNKSAQKVTGVDRHNISGGADIREVSIWIKDTVKELGWILLKVEVREANETFLTLKSHVYTNTEMMWMP